MDTKEICYIQDLHKVFQWLHKAWSDTEPQRDVPAFSNLRQNLACLQVPVPENCPTQSQQDTIEGMKALVLTQTLRNQS